MMFRVALLASSVAAVEVDYVQMYEGLTAGCAQLKETLCGSAKTAVGAGAVCKWATTCKLEDGYQTKLDALKNHLITKPLTDTGGKVLTVAEALLWKANPIKIFVGTCNLGATEAEQKKCCEGKTDYAYNRCTTASGPAKTTECKGANTPTGCPACVYAHTDNAAKSSRLNCADVPATGVNFQVPTGVLTWVPGNAAGAKCTITATFAYKKNACAAPVLAVVSTAAATTAAPKSSSATRGAPAGVTVLLGALALVGAMSA